MIEIAFRKVMADAGLISNDAIIGDGRLRRFHVKGDKPGSKNGWYILFADGVPSGVFGSWKSFASRGTWSAKERRDMTCAEKIEFQSRMAIARQAREKEEQAVKEVARQKAIALWQETKLIEDSPAHNYLKARGITQSAVSLRFHPSCYHSETKKHYPAMIAAVTRWPDNTPCAVHRTYLQGDKKANIQPNKMMLGAVTGGAVRLGAADSIVAVAEGIETALSVQQETGISAWAVLSAVNYKSLILPETVRDVLIAADHDPVGLQAAYETADIWAARGLTVRVIYPPHPNQDFNDLLRIKK